MYLKSYRPYLKQKMPKVPGAPNGQVQPKVPPQPRKVVPEVPPQPRKEVPEVPLQKPPQPRKEVPGVEPQ